MIFLSLFFQNNQISLLNYLQNQYIQIPDVVLSEHNIWFYQFPIHHLNILYLMEYWHAEVWTPER